MQKLIEIRLDETLGGWPSLAYLQELAGDGYRLVEAAEPQFVFFGPFPRKKRWPSLGRWSPLSRPPAGRYVRVFWTGENVAPDFRRYDWCFTFHLDELVGNPRHYRRPVWHPGVPTHRVEPLPRFEKHRFCNFVYSRPVPFREDFFRLLSAHKTVDSPGLSMNNMPPIGTYRSSYDSRYADTWEDEKRSFLKPYKFTIAFENESVVGYTTEKIYDPMLVDSIPIYWGNPEVARDYNTRAFVNWHDYGSHEATIRRIIEIDEDDALYRSMLREPWYRDEGRQVAAHAEGLRLQMRRIFDLGLAGLQP